MDDRGLLDPFGQRIHRPIPVSEPWSPREKKLALGGLGLSLFSAGEGPLLSIYPMTNYPLFKLLILIQSAIFLLIGLGLLLYVCITHFVGRQARHSAWMSPVTWTIVVFLVTIASLCWQIVRINEVTARLQARHLTEPQKDRMRDVFEKGPDISTKVWIISYPDCFECRAYAWDFADAMNHVPNWEMGNIGVLSYNPYAWPQLRVDWRGVIIGTRDPSHLSADEAALVKAMKVVHLDYTFKPFIWTDDKGKPLVALLIAPQGD